MLKRAQQTARPPPRAERPHSRHGWLHITFNLCWKNKPNPIVSVFKPRAHISVWHLSRHQPNHYERYWVHLSHESYGERPVKSLYLVRYNSISRRSKFMEWRISGKNNAETR